MRPLEAKARDKAHWVESLDLTERVTAGHLQGSAQVTRKFGFDWQTMSEECLRPRPHYYNILLRVISQEQQVILDKPRALLQLTHKVPHSLVSSGLVIVLAKETSKPQVGST